MNQQEIIATIGELYVLAHRASCRLFLTGSRFFDGNISSDTDWDFFTKANPEIIQALNAFGWADITVGNYNDGLPLEYRGLQGIVKIFRKNNVDVQLVLDPLKKHKIQETHKALFRHLKDDKPARTLVWRAAYKALS